MSPQLHKLFSSVPVCCTAFWYLPSCSFCKDFWAVMELLWVDLTLWRRRTVVIIEWPLLISTVTLHLWKVTRQQIKFLYSILRTFTCIHSHVSLFCIFPCNTHNKFTYFYLIFYVRHAFKLCLAPHIFFSVIHKPPIHACLLPCYIHFPCAVPRPFSDVPLDYIGFVQRVKSSIECPLTI